MMEISSRLDSVCPVMLVVINVQRLLLTAQRVFLVCFSYRVLVCLAQKDNTQMDRTYVKIVRTDVFPACRIRRVPAAIPATSSLGQLASWTVRLGISGTWVVRSARNVTLTVQTVVWLLQIVQPANQTLSLLMDHVCRVQKGPIIQQIVASFAVQTVFPVCPMCCVHFVT